MSRPTEISYLRILRRGLARRCPQCGVGRIFGRWMHVRERCGHCGLVFEPLEGNSWWFMYYTTGLLTGLFIIAMLLIRPTNMLLGRIVVFVAAIIAIVLTLPMRKGLGLAVDYLSELKAGHRDDIRPQ